MKLWTMVLLALAGCGDKGDDSSGGGDDGGPTDLVGDPVEGASVYATTCGTSNCHGADGSGSGSADAADLADVVPKRTDAEIASIIEDGFVLMAPVALNDQQAADVIAYLRQEFGG